MPRAPKPCARCTRPVRGRTYCDACQPIGWHANPSANGRTHTREERAAFRRAVLAREPRCRRCGARATEADHIVPVELGGTNDPEANGQGLCRPCHDAKTRAETANRNRRRGGRGTPPAPL